MLIQTFLRLISCFSCGSLIAVILILFPSNNNFLQTSYANQQQNHPVCSPSACGSIRNISYPFRLKNIDPPHCGDSNYELVCENTTTTTTTTTAFLYLNSQKFHVLAINYDNFTIRLVDATIKINGTTYCSFPPYSLSKSNFSGEYPYGLKSYKKPGALALRNPHAFGSITFMTCPYPINGSHVFVETTHCFNTNSYRSGHPTSSNTTTSTTHTYLKVGHLNASYFGENCKIEGAVMTSWKFKDEDNVVSVAEIYQSLLYGFELSWHQVLCEHKCKKNDLCYVHLDNTIICIQDDCHIFISPSFNCGRMRRFVNKLNVIINYAVSCIILPFIGATRILIGMPFVFGLLIYKYRRRHLSVFDAIECFLKSQNDLMPIRYSYSHIKKMTINFREKLGSGGYGSVYKGKLRSGSDVAIKLLNNDGQDFINEVATIGRIHHVNVVRLVGYCAERSKRALVYDFMPNGSLEKYIFDQERTNALSWDKKYEIALGVARGIEYLHRGCDIQILHFDIKPHNILLDQNFVPKISDFGLAKFYSTDNSIVTLTAARGTIGYVAPELINRSIGGVSYKADIYSFGMLLMEMLGLKRNLATDSNNSSMYFPYWIYDRFNKGKDIEIGNVDDDDDHARRITRKITIVALWCVQMNPGDRPSMSKVVEMLEKDEEDEQLLQVPPQPSSQTPQQMIQMVQDQTWGTTTDDDSNDCIVLMHEHASIDQ